MKYLYSKLILWLKKSENTLENIENLNKETLTNYNVKFGDHLQLNGIIKINSIGKIEIGSNCIINSGSDYNPVGLADKSQFYLSHDALLSIGNNVGISNSLFYCTVRITIEDDVLIGGGCQIFDTDFHSINYNDRILKNNINVKKREVIIKKGAFIGCNSIILKGVKIGERSVIGAGSVVRCNIPGDEMWAGNPAVFLKKLSQ